MVGVDDSADTRSWPAGWYADPWYSGQQRYWDGRAWTPHVQSGTGGAAAAQAPAWGADSTTQTPAWGGDSTTEIPTVGAGATAHSPARSAARYRYRR